jgi:hypothetical protein
MSTRASAIPSDWTPPYHDDTLPKNKVVLAGFPVLREGLVGHWACE